MYSVPVLQAFASTLFIAAAHGNINCRQFQNGGDYNWADQCALGQDSWYNCWNGAQVHHDASTGKIRLLADGREATVQVWCGGKGYNFHCDHIPPYYDDWAVCGSYIVDGVYNIVPK